MRCKKHPEYEGIKYPSPECPSCLRFWESNMDNEKFCESLPRWGGEFIQYAMDLALDEARAAGDNLLEPEGTWSTLLISCSSASAPSRRLMAA